MELSLPGAKVRWNESSIIRFSKPADNTGMWSVQFELWNFRSHVLSLPGDAKVGLSFPGTFVPWNFRSRERKWRGTFAPQHELSVKLLEKRGLEFGSCLTPYAID